ncbi:unnamed protein product, partial [Rotaria sp. Silwood2]
MSFPIWGLTWFRLAVGDFNNDNQLDIAFNDYDGGQVGVLLGYGNGAFGAPTRFSTGDDSYPVAITAADFNGDGNLDVAV